MFKKRLDEKGQSAVEFLLLLPVLVFVVLVSYQIFSIVYTSLVNQAAGRFVLQRDMANHRGYATRPPVAGVLDPIYPELEIFSEKHRAQNLRGVVNAIGAPPKPYFAVMVEEPRGSGLYPKRRLRTIGEKLIEVRSKVGICERSIGICQ